MVYYQMPGRASVVGIGIERRIVYFARPGPANTQTTLELALDRARTLGLKHIVVASITGKGALRLAKMAEGGANGSVPIVTNPLNPASKKCEGIRLLRACCVNED